MSRLYGAMLPKDERCACLDGHYCRFRLWDEGLNADGPKQESLALHRLVEEYSPFVSLLYELWDDQGLVAAVEWISRVTD